MMYLLDTDTCAEYLRNRNRRVARRLLTTPTSEVAVCSVVIGELYYGAFHSSLPSTNFALLARFLPQFTSLPLDDDAAKVYGRIRADLAARGQSIGPNDTMIAAIALFHGLTLVTHNTKDFSRVTGLSLDDWSV